MRKGIQVTGRRLPAGLAAALLGLSLLAGCSPSDLGQGALTIHVSPQGDDRGDGSQGRPARSLERARQLARPHLKGMGGDVRVELAGGTYRLTQTLAFDPGDSGDNGHNVVYAAAAGQAPVLSGALKVTGWHPAD